VRYTFSVPHEKNLQHDNHTRNTLNPYCGACTGRAMSSLFRSEEYLNIMPIMQVVSSPPPGCHKKVPPAYVRTQTIEKIRFVPVP